LQVLQILADSQEKAFACFGQHQLSGAALEEADTQIAFQRRDIAADGCRSDRKPAFPCEFSTIA
jgi:hypothetical protein